MGEGGLAVCVGVDGASLQQLGSTSTDALHVLQNPQRLRERRRCVIVLLCGTSGSGKSTLAAILANRLGITTVVSTDSIRHMVRSLAPRDAAPLLWASTYQAGEVGGGGGEVRGARGLCRPCSAWTGLLVQVHYTF